MLFNLQTILNTIDNNTIFHAFVFFLIIDLYFLFFSIITEIFNPFAKLEIPMRIETNEAKAETETHPARADIKINYCSN